ncbi:hypothetical protein M378DRAFT_173215 [Amanita muscaria Koide BX008]|uniref:Uncharacterized protein n=1 Tax=Amanita muscaria (strain Koide BX008) TaxID=946122 RepID=A0A0C2WIB3_AMAMK|nr:hypothetical protein M378DRAFT_173215 [Amanita muscaria Koide BX008]
MTPSMISSRHRSTPHSLFIKKHLQQNNRNTHTPVKPVTITHTAYPRQHSPEQHMRTNEFHSTRKHRFQQPNLPSFACWNREVKRL